MNVGQVQTRKNRINVYMQLLARNLTIGFFSVIFIAVAMIADVRLETASADDARRGEGETVCRFSIDSGIGLCSDFKKSRKTCAPGNTFDWARCECATHG